MYTHLCTDLPPTLHICCVCIYFCVCAHHTITTWCGVRMCDSCSLCCSQWKTHCASLTRTQKLSCWEGPHASWVELQVPSISCVIFSWFLNALPCPFGRPPHGGGLFCFAHVGVGMGTFPAWQNVQHAGYVVIVGGGTHDSPTK